MGLSNPAFLASTRGRVPFAASLLAFVDPDDVALADGSDIVTPMQNKGILGGTMAPSATRPKIATSVALGARRVIRGLNSWLTSSLAASSWSFLSNDSEWSLYIPFVAATANPNTIYYLVGNATLAGNAGKGTSLFYDDRASVPRSDALGCIISSVSSTANLLTAISGAGAVPQRLWHLMCVTSTKQGSQSQINIYVDDILVVSVLSAGGLAGNTPGVQPFVVGASSNGTSPLNGDHGRCCIWAGAHDATQRNAIRDWYQSHYNTTFPVAP